MRAAIVVVLASAGVLAWAGHADAKTIGSISPASALPGDVVTVIGRGFGARNARVDVCGLDAELVRATGYLVSFVVPVDAPPGPCTVVVTNPGGIVFILAQQLNVLPPPFANQAPVIDSVVASAATVDVGSAIALTAVAHDPDPGETAALTELWTVASAPAGSTATPLGSLATTFTPDVVGTYHLTLTVTDPHGASASATVELAATVPSFTVSIALVRLGTGVWQLSAITTGGSPSRRRRSPGRSSRCPASRRRPEHCRPRTAQA